MGLGKVREGRPKTAKMHMRRLDVYIPQHTLSQVTLTVSLSRLYAA
jgi:hypothetical protein